MPAGAERSDAEETRYTPFVLGCDPATLSLRADVAELVDAHGSGPCGRKLVEVQVLSSASGVCSESGNTRRTRLRPRCALSTAFIPRLPAPRRRRTRPVAGRL